MYKLKGKPSPQAYNIYEDGKHTVIFDWEFDFSSYDMDLLKQFAEGHQITIKKVDCDPEAISSRGVIMLFSTNCNVEAELKKKKIIGFKERFHVITATKENSPNCSN